MESDVTWFITAIIVIALVSIPIAFAIKSIIDDITNNHYN